jgi:hypothetical protein
VQDTFVLYQENVAATDLKSVILSSRLDYGTR